MCMLIFIHLHQPIFKIRTMNLQKIILSLCVITITFWNASAQNHDPRLEPYFSKEEIQTMQKNEPSRYAFIVNALNKAIFIAEIPKEKTPVTYNGTLNIDPSGNHTFLSLGLNITDHYQYYKIEGTEKMLVVLPRIFLENK